MLKQRFPNCLLDRSGAAAVEFAIVGPIFMLILMGLLAFGIYFGAAHSVQQLAADAARTAVAGLDEAERIQLAKRFISTNGGEYILIDPQFLAVDVADSRKDGSQFRVVVEYDAAHLPMWNLYRDLPLPGRLIVRSAIIRVGGI
ncbi:MAG: TadE/TadG family type IV pilus assembly protein [Rhizobiaceae bacterium]